MEIIEDSPTLKYVDEYEYEYDNNGVEEKRRVYPVGSSDYYYESVDRNFKFSGIKEKLGKCADDFNNMTEEEQIENLNIWSFCTWQNKLGSRFFQCQLR